jgi:hypothetical protein
VGSWLAQRDISGFAAQARAPMTTAKMEMFGDALGSFDYYVFQAITNETAPFDKDLISVEDALSRLPYETQNVRPAPTVC